MSHTFAHHRLRAVAVLALLLAAAAPARAQSGSDEALDRVGRALQSGDAGDVLADAGARVELVLFGDGGMYRKGQATHVLRDFFRRYPPERVVFGERSTSDDGRTVVGRYWTRDGGTPLGVRVVHRSEGGLWRLVAVRIDRPSTVRSGR